MSELRTSISNPGGARRRPAPTVRAVASGFARSLLGGRPGDAVRLIVAGLENVVRARAEALLPLRVECPACGWRGPGFQHHVYEGQVVWGSACPLCDSRSRHRGLAILLPQVLADFPRPIRILHVAPEPILRRVLAGPGIVYRSADLHLSDVDFPGEDLQRLSLTSSTFDLVVCNHVLEHLPDDAAAIREIARVLTPAGMAVLTVPGDFDRPGTVEWSKPDANGHLRDYGAAFRDRLAVGFGAVEMLDLHALNRSAGGLSRGIRPRDMAFVCRRPQEPAA